MKNAVSLLLFEILIILSIPYIVARHRPDVVLVRGGGPGWIPGLYFLGFRLLGVPVVLECNGIAWEELDGRDVSRLTTRVVMFSAWQQASSCNTLIAVTEEIGAAYCRLAGRPTADATEIPNGVDPAEFDCSTKARQLYREARSITPGEFVAGYVGSFTAWHGVLEILEAASVLKKRDVPVTIVLVGTGELLERAQILVETMALKNVVLAGAAKGRQDLVAWMSCFDVGLCPNRQIHGSPLKFFEYLACGLPIIGSGVPQILRMIRQEEQGIAMDTPSGSGIANAIETVRNRPAWAAAVGSRNRSAAERHHSWAGVSARVLDVLGNAAGAGSRS